MTDFTQQLDDYVAAYEADDQKAVNAVFKTIDDDDIDAFLAEAERRLPDMARGHRSPSTEGLDAALQADGLAPEQSADLSILASGTFREWVEHRMRARGIGPDTITEDLANQSDLDDETLDLAGEWLAAVSSGDTDPRELPAEAIDAIAIALDASPRTIMSLAEAPTS